MYFSSYMTGWQMAVSLFRQFFDRRIRTDGCDSSTSCHGLRLSAWWAVLLRLHRVTVGECQGSPLKPFVNSENQLNGSQMMLVRYGLFIISNESNTTDFLSIFITFHVKLWSLNVFLSRMLSMKLWFWARSCSFSVCFSLHVNTEETNGTTLPFLCNISKVGVQLHAISVV